MYGIDGAVLAVMSFYVRRHSTDSCGPNGLPLTPNTVRICGLAQQILALKHPNIAEYIATEIVAGEKVAIVSEHYSNNLSLLVAQNELGASEICRLMYGILSALSYLHAQDIVCRNLCPENILLTTQNKPKLSQYGLFHMTCCGSAVDFPIGAPAYLSPNLIQRHPTKYVVGNPKEDVWAVGVILLELLTCQRAWISPNSSRVRNLSFGSQAQSKLTEKETGSNMVANTTVIHNEDIYDLCRHIHEFLRNKELLEDFKATNVDRNHMIKYFSKIIPEIDSSRLDSFSNEILEVVYFCLSPAASTRPTVDDLLQHSCFAPFVPTIQLPSPQVSALRCAHLDFSFSVMTTALQPTATSDEHVKELASFWENRKQNPLFGMPFKDVYYLWLLTGGGPERLSIGRNGDARSSIHRLPKLVRLGLPEISAQRDPSLDFDDSVRVIEIDRMVQRLIEENVDPSPAILSQPENLGESSLVYQYQRLVIFNRLLAGHPFTHDLLVHEAAIDIPPYHRGQIWAALLNVSTRSINLYAKLDKDKKNSIDHQLDVDIPRCHQYDILLSSPTGHGALKRVLKGWVIAHPHLTYWQGTNTKDQSGVDSLSAPFVRLHLNNEAIAFACLSNFVELYMPNFFQRNNSTALNEAMEIFWQLLAFHDPELWSHFEEMGFKPDLFAIPWFLTCFAHVFSLDKIFILWDSLLLSNSSMILCIAMAIMRQSRSQLLGFDFHECILHFGDSPDVDFDATMQIARNILKGTPASFFARSAIHPRHRHWDEAHPIPTLDDLRKTPVPSLSIADFEEMFLDLQGKPYSQSAARVICIDARARSTFAIGHCAGCINLPVDMVIESGVLKAPFMKLLRETVRGRPIVVLGTSKHDDGSKLARAAVLAGISGVCVLSGGVTELRSLGLLRCTGNDTNLQSVLDRISARSSRS
eukprot:gene5492-7184_t